MLKTKAIIQLKGQSIDDENNIVADYSATILSKHNEIVFQTSVRDTEKYQTDIENYKKDKQKLEEFAKKFLDILDEDNEIIDNDITTDNGIIITELPKNPFE